MMFKFGRLFSLAMLATLCVAPLGGCYITKRDSIANRYASMPTDELKTAETDELLWAWKWRQYRRHKWDEEMFQEVKSRVELTDKQEQLIRERKIRVGMPLEIVELSWGMGYGPHGVSVSWLGKSYRYNYKRRVVYYDNDKVSYILARD